MTPTSGGGSGCASQWSTFCAGRVHRHQLHWNISQDANLVHRWINDFAIVHDVCVIGYLLDCSLWHGGSWIWVGAESTFSYNGGKAQPSCSKLIRRTGEQKSYRSQYGDGPFYFSSRFVLKPDTV